MSSALPNNTYAPIIHNGLGIITGNSVAHSLQRNNYLLSATTINNKARDSIYTKSGGDQFVVSTNGDIITQADTGNIILDAGYPGNTAISLIASNSTGGGITLESGNGGIILNTTGGITIAASGNSDIYLGSNTTGNITLESNLNVNILTSDFQVVATDNITLKSIDGEIKLMSANNDPTQCIVMDNGGNLIIGDTATEFGYKTELKISTEASSVDGRNGMLVYSANADISPEFRVNYTNPDGSRDVSTTFGVYSANSSAAVYQKYTAYQHGSLIIRLSGPEFTYNDVGRRLIQQTNGSISVIQDIGTVILPPVRNTGLATLTAGGVYLGSHDMTVIVQIDSENGGGRDSDTFRWSADGGANWQETFVPVKLAVGQRYPLNIGGFSAGLPTGIYITFNSATISSVGDNWTIYAKVSAIVNSNVYPSTGNATVNTTSGLVFGGIYTNNNQPILIGPTTEGSPVKITLSDTQVLQSTDTMVSMSAYTGYIGTDTNNDFVIKTGGTERLRVAADGSLCVGTEGGDARLQLVSNFNAPLLVNDNLIVSGATANTGILGFQQNPASTEINTGGYVIVYESVDQLTGNTHIYGNYFTANGDKLGESFKINRDPSFGPGGEPVIYNQFQPHCVKSNDPQSDEYIVVWTSQEGSTNTGNSIRFRIYNNGTDTVVNDSLLPKPDNHPFCMNPRVCSYSNGYIIAYNTAGTASTSNIYTMHYTPINRNPAGGFYSVGSPIEITTHDPTKSHVYPYVCGLSRNDIAAPGGFVATYLAQTFENDPRYQLKYRVFNSDLSNASTESNITTTGFFNSQNDQDLSLSDGLPSCAPMPDGLAKLTGGFVVAFSTNYSSAIPSASVPAGVNVYGLSSQAFGRLNSITTLPNNSKVLNLSNVYLNFIQGEQLSLVSQDGYLIEKAASISTSANAFIQHTANITLSTDPKNIQLVSYGTATLIGNPTAEADELFRRQINSGDLVVDSERINLPSDAAGLSPINFVRRTQPNFYAYRPLTHVKTNGSDECIVAWESGSLPHVYSQRVSLPLGQLVGGEKLYAQNALGQRQTDPFVSTLVSTQGGVLGYSMAFGQSAVDLSNTAIQQELSGSYSYLLHINNQTAEFVVSHDGQLGLGTTAPEATLHVAALPSANPSDTQTASMILQTPSQGINTIEDKHQIRFTDGAGTDLARIKVKYSDYYQDLNPQADKLISYFKFDETAGTLAARNTSAYNIQSNVSADLSNINSGLINNQTQSGILIGFDAETCWQTGKINNGLRFDGYAQNNYVVINGTGDVSSPYPQTIPSMGDGSFAISTWLQTVGTSFSNSNVGIVSIGSEPVGGTDGSSGAFQLLLRNDVLAGGSNLYPVFRLTNGSVIDVASPVSTIGDEQWHHVVWDYYGSATSNMANIWIDGQLVKSQSITPKITIAKATTNTGFKQTFIGSNVGGNGLFYNGMMDELRFYKTHLSASEIDRLYSYGAEQRASLLIQTLGTNSTFSDTGAGLVLDDTGCLLGAQFRNNTSRILSGALYFKNPGESTVYGSGTQFLTEVSQGDNILIAEGAEISDITSNLYQVVSISNNTVLTIDRPPPSLIVSTSNTTFDNVTIFPGIFSARDENQDLKMTMNSFGDLIIGSRRSTTNPTRVEIRGSGEDENKNGLTLHNTNTSDIAAATAGDRANKIYFKTANTVSQADVLQGLVKTSLSGAGRYASKMEFLVNDNPSTDVVSDSGLVCVLGLSNSAMFVGDGSPLAAGIAKGVLNIQSYASDPLTLTFVNKQSAAAKVFGDSIDMLFYNEALAANHNNELIKLKASQDYPSPSTGSKACGRIDFFVATEEPLYTGTFADKDNIADPQSLGRFCITSNGFVGVHSQRPHGVFQVSPRCIDDQYKVFTAAINATTGGGNINVADIISTTAPGINNYLLRGGSFVVYDGSSLTAYPLSNITDPIIVSGVGGVPIGTSNIQLTDTNAPLAALTNRPYSLHYPGMIVNKYGLVGIGNTSFSDADTSFHLDVSGNTAIKGVLAFGANISSSVNPSAAPGLRASNDGSNLEIRAASGSGFLPVVDYIGRSARPIRQTTADDISLATDYTILADIGASGITLPTPSASDLGKILVIKNMNSTGMPINCAVSVDGAPISLTLSQYQSRTFQVALLLAVYQYVIIGSS
jgi:hypothetical protein